MKKKVFEVLDFTIELTVLKNAGFVFVTESKTLEIDTWRVGIQTPYQQLPTVINLNEGLSSDETLDNMVRSITKKIGLPVVGSINISQHLINQNMILNLSKVIIENLNEMRAEKEGKEPEPKDTPQAENQV